MYLDQYKRLIERDRGPDAVSICAFDRQHDLQGMDDSRNVTQYGQEDVDEEVGIATALEEDTKRRENDGEDDLADVAKIRQCQQGYSSCRDQVGSKGRTVRRRRAMDFQRCRGWEVLRLALP